jgi:hypothetical protein
MRPGLLGNGFSPKRTRSQEDWAHRKERSDMSEKEDSKTVLKESSAEEKSLKLLEVIHDLKHGDFDKAMEKMRGFFPSWKEVESYDPDESTAFDYLFDTVLS